MFGETSTVRVVIWNHPIETTICKRCKRMFQVPIWFQHLQLHPILDFEPLHLGLAKPRSDRQYFRRHPSQLLRCLLGRPGVSCPQCWQFLSNFSGVVLSCFFLISPTTWPEVSGFFSSKGGPGGCDIRFSELRGMPIVCKFQRKLKQLGLV